MARTKKKETIPDTLQLDYTLAELPSSQHRAGLAGLVLMVRWLHRFEEWKKNDIAICELQNLTNYSITLKINQLGLQALFNQVYEASWGEQERAQVLKNKKKEVIPYLREEERDEINKKGKPIKKKVYIYQVVVPKGAFIADADAEGDRGKWIKLWRDFVWSILRGVPTTRSCYENRANGNYTNDADDVWNELLNPAEFTVDLPSSYYLGAQASNPENIPFKDRASYRFLLHFWVFASFIYVPQVLKLEREKDKVDVKNEFVGYAIAIPDVANLKIFCDDEFLGLLKDRGNEVTGYRPRDAVIDIAVEGAIDMMARLRDRISRSNSSIGDLVMGVDVIHAEKQGNNVRILGSTRLDPPEPQWIDQYREIRNNLKHSIFRRQRLLNLVSNKAWYTGFDSLLCTIPYELTMENEYFRHDVRESFKYEGGNMTEENDHNQQDGNSPEYSCEKLVLRLVKSYVSRKLESKYQLKWKDEWTPLTKSKKDRDRLNNDSDYKNYTEKKAKIAKSAFLDVRSRTEKIDFINYFASTICSVSQYMNESDFENLTRDLYEDTDRVRTLTMLALSANG